MNFEKIIKEHSLTVRCLPYVVVSYWSYRPGETKYKDAELVLLNGRKVWREEVEVDKGGWWYVKETKHTDGTVRFERRYDKFFAPTLKEALTLYLNSKKTK
jgi:hypothetical protein